MGLRRLLLACAALAALMLAPAGPSSAQALPTCDGVPATIVGTPRDETLPGDDRRNVIIGGGGNDIIDAKGGDDLVCAGNGDGSPGDVVKDDDEVRAGEGDDKVKGGFGNDRIQGEGGNDVLEGDDGEPSGFISTTDRIDGGDGQDLLTGGGDQDILRGGSGADRIRADASPLGRDAAPPPRGYYIDVVIGGPGQDLCTADDEDDVSECDDAQSLPSNDDPFDNFFGSIVSARRPAPSGSSGSSDSADSRGSEPSPTADLFGVLGRVASSRCLKARPLTGKRGVDAFRLGERTAGSLLRPAVLPIAARRGRYVYCNATRGRTYLLTSQGKVLLVATTADSRRTRGIDAGDRLKSLLVAYPTAEKIGTGLYRAPRRSPVVFGVSRGRVKFVAVAPKALLEDPPALARALRRLAPGR